jgi:SNF family Na+-dependent transporter
MENGKTLKTDCKNCNQKSTLNVNKFYAKESKLISILAGIIFIVGTFIGLYFVMQMISEMKTVMGIFVVACGLLIPVWIFGILSKEDRNRVKTFNQTYVSE